MVAKCRGKNPVKQNHDRPSRLKEYFSAEASTKLPSNCLSFKKHSLEMLTNDIHSRAKQYCYN